MLINVLLLTATIILSVGLYFYTDQRLAIVLLSLAYQLWIMFQLFSDIINKKEVSDRNQENVDLSQESLEELKDYISKLKAENKNLKESSEKHRRAAFHDHLTGLPNRNLFLETLKFILHKRQEIGNFNFAILFLDLNRFKTINDSLGHSTGDRLILAVARRLSDLARKGDLVARFSGDEFAIILNSVTGIEEVIVLADYIKQQLSDPFHIGERAVFSSASIGIALGNKEYNEAEDMLRDADIAMYNAKANEKGIAVFSRSMHTHALNMLQVETDLRRALEKDEFCAFFQPIIDLDSMHLVGFESLIRWNHPTKGLVPPNDFIPVSEETNLIIPITLWMLRHCCEQLVRWNENLAPSEKLFLSINLSGKHFSDKQLVNQVKRVLEDTGLDPCFLKLEITESAIMSNADAAIKMLKQLKDLGIKLSIDDFGTGYSSLSYLHRFPIDTLKIDRSFVSTMENATENGEIVRTIIALAKTLGMNVIAEGIETIHQLHQLRILRCEYGQGYLFSRPVPLREAEQIIADKEQWQRSFPASITGKSFTDKAIQIPLTH